MDSIKTIKFINYKAFSNYTIHLKDMNILIGPNNSGKSTIIGAFRILDVCLRRAYAKKCQRLYIGQNEITNGHYIPEDNVAVSLENVHTNYNDEESRIEYLFTNGNSIILVFPSNERSYFSWELKEGRINTIKDFKEKFPIKIQVVPVLGPLEHNEKIVTKDTVSRALNTHRACRHFRNYWRYFIEGWDEFASLVSETWPGMRIEYPEIDQNNNEIFMFCAENRMDREIYWAGFGFQIWCQLLTHLSRANESNVLIIDEPEIYLHPEVQRQLIEILRNLNCDIIIATHSIEIITEANPEDILTIDKDRYTAIRLKDIEGIQKTIDYIGSGYNITLTKLARNRKMFFIEGMSDYRIIKKFSNVLGYSILNNDYAITPFETKGFSSWPEVKALNWGLNHKLNADIKCVILYDRDYICDEERDEILHEISSVEIAHIHTRKEMENYLLEPDILEKATIREIEKRNSQNENNRIEYQGDIHDILDKITSELKSHIQGQYIAKRIEYFKKDKKDDATITKKAIDLFESDWKSIYTRMKIVPGKEVIRSFREEIRREYCINLTDTMIIKSFRRKDVSDDLQDFLVRLNEFVLHG